MKCISLIFQHSSLTYSIPLVKCQRGFYEIGSLAICINIQIFCWVNRKDLNIPKAFLEYLEFWYCCLLKMIQCNNKTCNGKIIKTSGFCGNAHLLDLFKTRCFFIKRIQYLQIKPSEQETCTNKSMMVKMFHLFGFIRWTKCIWWAI